MDGKGRATDNAFIERLWRTVKYENIRFKDYKNGVDMRLRMAEFFPKYNGQRRHYSLGQEYPEKIYKQGLIVIF